MRARAVKRDASAVEQAAQDVGPRTRKGLARQIGAAGLLALQREVGNAAVSDLVRGSRRVVVQRNCGRGSPLLSAGFDLPGINSGGGLAHAATVHTGSGHQQKGSFFPNTSDEDLYGMAQRVLRQAYEAGTIHESHVDPGGLPASRFRRSAQMGKHVGWSRNTGATTDTVECVFALQKWTEATVVTMYPL